MALGADLNADQFFGCARMDHIPAGARDGGCFVCRMNIGFHLFLPVTLILERVYYTIYSYFASKLCCLNFSEKNKDSPALFVHILQEI
jgi:hypothetical protein